MDHAKHPRWRLLLGRLAFVTPRLGAGSERHHFVREYDRLVRRLMADYPRDVAMSLAVGGAYDEMGARQAEIVSELGGLEPAGRLLDLGCGSGRLPAALSRRIEIDYTGVDIMPELLAYARTRSPPHYRFVFNRSFELPLEPASFDLVCGFSIFTHLRHEESYAYLSEVRRVLRPGGRVLFSFWEFAEPSHWFVFEETLDGLLRAKQGISNVYLERSVIALWAQRLGFGEPTFVGPGESGVAGRLGQSVAILSEPANAMKGA